MTLPDDPDLVRVDLPHATRLGAQPPITPGSRSGLGSAAGRLPETVDIRLKSFHRSHDRETTQSERGKSGLRPGTA
jgi:hypothetical protein